MQIKKLKFQKDIAPHLLAVVVFLLATLIFFRPVFTDNMQLDQHDINQFIGSSKSLTDYRKTTGKEGLWASNMFSGMPAYLVNVRWSNEPINYAKRVLGCFLPHPIANIFIAFISYYILLLSFRVRPYLAIAGALAFGFSSYMIIGLVAGHNSRIGAIALMPLVMAGIHVAFTGKRLLGAGLTSLALALHLRENHLQITYYLILIVLAYGLIQLIVSVKEKSLGSMLKTLGVLLIGVVFATASFSGQFWAIKEYSAYSIRGTSELTSPTHTVADGLSKSYAFEYSNGLFEPMTLFVPNIFGGASSNYLVSDRESKTFKALVTSQNQSANELARYTSSYWGNQPLTAPYYAGAILCFLFVLGFQLAPRRYVYWLGGIAVMGIVISWGDNFKPINYFLFETIPGFNKFRSVTFSLCITLFALPLLGMLGVEKIWSSGLSPYTKKIILRTFIVVGSICLILIVLAGSFLLLKPDEEKLPQWLAEAMSSDRAAMMRVDAFRSLAFVSAIFILLWFDIKKRLPLIVFASIFVLFTVLDITSVSRRYISKDNYRHKRQLVFNQPSAADNFIAQDHSDFRVLNLQNPFNEAHTSYFHQSIGGYHGAKIRRYQDVYDSVMVRDINQLIKDGQSTRFDFAKYQSLNMLNTKYITYGPSIENIVKNENVYGSAWFANDVIRVQSPNEELKALQSIHTKNTVVVDESAFPVSDFSYDSLSTITLVKKEPAELTYEYDTKVPSLVVFSEIYYPKGWYAAIDGKEAQLIRVNYVLRGLEVPAGKHTIACNFKPTPYFVGNHITTFGSWISVLFAMGCFFYALLDRNKD